MQPVTASFHARDRFTSRICSDVSIIESCWHDAEPVETRRRDNDDHKYERLYSGPLCQDFVMFGDDAEGAVGSMADIIIRSVVPAEDIEIVQKQEVAV